MKHFVFRLSRVLRVRRVEEDAARGRFQECVGVVRRAEEIADTLGDQLQQARLQLMDTREHKRSTPAELLLAHNTLEGLEENLYRQRRSLAELQLEADRLRASWEQARQQRLALEQLEDRRRRDHFDEQEKSANLELDEIALRRACSRTDETCSSFALGRAEETTRPDSTQLR